MTLLVTVTGRRFGCMLVLVSEEPRGPLLEYYQLKAGHTSYKFDSTFHIPLGFLGVLFPLTLA